MTILSYLHAFFQPILRGEAIRPGSPGSVGRTLRGGISALPRVELVLLLALLAAARLG